jgi:hypothetical protein
MDFRQQFAHARLRRQMLRLARENASLRGKRIPHSDYLFRTVTHWRMRAEAIRTLAEDAQDPKVRAMMLRIAADYDRLARKADDRAAQDSIMFRGVSPAGADIE